MIQTRLEIVNHVKNVTRETQIDSYIRDMINLTLQEINEPGWAYEQAGLRGYNHLWSFNRRKHNFATVASTEDYMLPRDVDKIGLIRETDTPNKLLYVPDEIMYEFIPSPTATGNPKYYRIWEEEGVSTALAEDDTINIVSSSTSDGSSFTVRVTGYDNNGTRISETYTLNGTTTVSGSKTFDARSPIYVSKSADTTGSITVTEASGATTLVVLGPAERSPRFKVISLYPIPSSAITLYLEYYTRLRNLEHDTDVPQIDPKWIWVLTTGVMAKIYQYQNKESMFTNAQNMYASGVRSMVKGDLHTSDYIPSLRSQWFSGNRTGKITYSDLGYGSFGLSY